LGAGYVDRVRVAVDEAVAGIERVATQYGANTDASRRGFVAEAHHVGSFNIDAARRDLDIRTEVVSSTVRGSPDVVFIEGGQTVGEAQVKYYATAGKTAAQLRDPHYADGQLIVPADQVDGVREAARASIDRLGHRPEVARQTRRVVETADGSLRNRAESRPLDDEEAFRLARDARDGTLDRRQHGYTTEASVRPEDLARQSAEAAASAAIVSAAVAAAPQVWRAMERVVSSGEFPAEELQAALRDGGRSAAAGALRGAIAASLTATCRAGLAGEALRNVDPTGVGAGVAVAFQAVNDAMRQVAMTCFGTVILDLPP